MYLNSNEVMVKISLVYQLLTNVGMLGWVVIPLTIGKGMPIIKSLS